MNICERSEQNNFQFSIFNYPFPLVYPSNVAQYNFEKYFLNLCIG